MALTGRQRSAAGHEASAHRYALEARESVHHADEARRQAWAAGKAAYDAANRAAKLERRARIAAIVAAALLAAHGLFHLVEGLLG